MNSVLSVVDNAALVYVLPSAYFIFKLGEAAERNNPSLRFWQHATGSLVFISLTLRRFWWESPIDVPSAADALVRAAAFACMSVGLAGVIGYGFLALVLVWSHISWRLASWKSRWSMWRKRKTKLNDDSSRLANREHTQQQKDSQNALEKEADQRKKELAERKARLAAEARKRRSMLLQAKIALETTLDDSLRRKMKELLTEFAGNELPIDEVEEHLGVMHEVMQRFNSQPTHFGSVAEILAHYAKERAQLDETDLPLSERQQLHALLAMEQQIAVQEFSQ